MTTEVQKFTDTTEGHFDWAGVRAEFPVTETFAYLNSAGAGPVSRRVNDAAAQFYRETEESGDRLWEHWLARRERARADVARLINAEPDEIAFTTNTSSGMNLIVDALEGRGAVVSCELEFPVTTIPWLHRGQRVRMVEARGGVLRAEDVLAAAGAERSVICLSHVQYSNGLRTPVEDPFAMRNDSYRLKADAAARAETGCPHFAGIFALGEAARQSLDLGVGRVERRALALNRRLTESLQAAGHQVLSPLGDERFRSAETLVRAADPPRAVRHLAARRVAVTIKPEGFRAATHYFNDDSDITR